MFPLIDLYYLEKNSMAQFSSIPQGILSIARMVQGKSQYWQKITPENQIKPKTIVFADWSINNWNQKKKNDVKQIFSQLLQEGFTIYIWQDGQFQKMTSAMQLFQWVVNSKVTPAHFDEILEKGAKAHKLTFDNTYIVDDHRTNLLLGKFTDAPRSINISDFFFQKPDVREKILQVIQNASPPVEEVLIDQLNKDTSKLRQIAHELWPQLNLIEKYETIDHWKGTEISLTSDNIAQSIELYDGLNTNLLFQSHIHTLHLMEKDTLSALHNFNLTGLEALECFGLEKIDLSLYPNLKNAIQQLKYLKLHCTSFFIKDLDQFNTEQLEYLEMTGSSIDATLLNKILSSATQLSELNIVEGDSPTTFLETFKLEHLDSLMLRANLALPNYQMLFKAAEHLKHVSITMASQEKNRLASSLDNVNFSELETFELNGNESYVKIKNIFNKSSKLRALFLYEIDFDVQSREPFELSQLKLLTLHKVNISEELLHRMLKASAESLTYLDLSHSIMNDEYGAVYNWSDDFTLKNLTEFKMNSSIWSLSPLKAIIKNAPNLKMIDFDQSDFMFEETLDWLADCPLPQLEELNLSAQNLGCRLEIDNLNQFLKQTMHLKRLNLRKLENLKKPLEGNFSYLESLDLSDTNISVEHLKIMLKNMPNLRYLNVKECRNIVADEELQALFNKIDVVEQAPKKLIHHHHGGSHDAGANFFAKSNVLYEDSGTSPATTKPSSPVNEENTSKPRTSGASHSQHPQNNITASSVPPKGSSIKMNEAHSPNIQAAVDSNTQKEDKTFNVQRIFYSPFDEHHPSIEYYRLQTFDSTTLNPNLNPNNSPFILSNTKDVELEPTHIQQENEDVFKLASKKSIYGKQSFTLHEDWQAIASLNAAEKMTHFHVTPEANVEIQYSNRDNLYYIRSTKAQTVTLDFLIEPSPFIEPQLSEDIQAIVNTFKNFKEGQLKLKKKNPRSIDYLNAILEQKVGACRHRSVAFKLYMEQHHPNTPVRVVSNGCHMFVEIKQNGIWILTDLGGYEAQLDIDETNRPTEAKPSETTKMHIEYTRTQQKCFLQTFETWRTKDNVQPNTCNAFMHTIVHKHKKSLIQLPGSHISSFNISLQTYAKHNHHPIFYVHSPDGLVCSAPFVKRLDHHRGVVQEGPGGPLYDFLTATRDVSENTPIILVNYANFLPDDVVRFNSLLDNTRMADGTKIPENTHIVGMIDPKKPGSYQGGDFYSRFEEIHPCPTRLIPAIQPVLKALPETQTKYTTINLCHSTAWEAQLLGGWILKDGQLYFEEGELIQALRQNLPIEIQNPPHDETFQLFWQQAHLYQVFQCNGERIAFPKDTNVFWSDGYSWNSMLQDVTWQPFVPLNAHLLNPTLLNSFLGNYQFQNNALSKCPGILQQHAHGQVDVFLTRSMSDDQWGLLLSESRKNNIHLSITCAPGVSLPDGFPNVEISALTELNPWNPAFKDKTQQIESKDCDLTIAMLKQQNPAKEWLVIDVSELSNTDLLKKIDGKLLKKEELGLQDEKQPYDFHFNETSKALLNTLNSHQNVILTGHFSNELEDSLASFLHERIMQQDAPGQLVLVHDKPFSFGGLSIHYRLFTR